MHASELMTRAPFTIDRRATIGEAIAALVEYGVRHLPIVDGARAVAIVSDRDLRSIEGLVARDLGQARPGALPVYDAPVLSVVRGEPICVTGDTPAREAIDRMLDQNVSSVLVVDEVGRLVGIITSSDVMRAARETL